jgi:hypothetical protein
MIRKIRSGWISMILAILTLRLIFNLINLRHEFIAMISAECYTFKLFISHMLIS